MKFTEDDDSALREIFRLGQFDQLIEQYLIFCQGASVEEKDTQKASSKKDKQFPNLAGFCRYIGTSTEKLSKIMSKHPEEYGKLLAILEDEALNSSISPTVISAYLKKRLGYEKDSSPPKSESTQLKICFEHDIFKDGE